MDSNAVDSMTLRSLLLLQCWQDVSEHHGHVGECSLSSRAVMTSFRLTVYNMTEHCGVPYGTDGHSDPISPLWFAHPFQQFCRNYGVSSSRCQVHYVKTWHWHEEPVLSMICPDSMASQMSETSQMSEISWSISVFVKWSFLKVDWHYVVPGSAVSVQPPFSVQALSWTWEQR